MEITHGQLLEAKYLLSLSNLVYSGAEYAASLLRLSYVKVVPVAHNGSECLLVLTESKIMVVFQGTADAVDVVRGLSFGLKKVSGGRVHEGFLEAYRQVEDKMLDAMENLNPHRVYPVHVTGHSLGGAMAAQAILALKVRGHIIADSFVFAAPKVGDPQWSAMFKSLGMPLYNIVHNLDVVPMLPPFLRYKTAGTRLYLSNEGVFSDSRKYSLKFLTLSIWGWLFTVPTAHKTSSYITALNSAISNYTKEPAK